MVLEDFLRSSEWTLGIDDPVFVWKLGNPITGIAGCCARATTGHAAALPSPTMNSRRRISHASQPLYGQ